MQQSNTQITFMGLGNVTRTIFRMIRDEEIFHPDNYPLSLDDSSPAGKGFKDVQKARQELEDLERQRSRNRFVRYMTTRRDYKTAKKNFNEELKSFLNKFGKYPLEEHEAAILSGLFLDRVRDLTPSNNAKLISYGDTRGTTEKRLLSHGYDPHLLCEALAEKADSDLSQERPALPKALKQVESYQTTLLFHGYLTEKDWNIMRKTPAQYIVLFGPQDALDTMPQGFFSEYALALQMIPALQYGDPWVVRAYTHNLAPELPEGEFLEDLREKHRSAPPRRRGIYIRKDLDAEPPARPRQNRDNGISGF